MVAPQAPHIERPDPDPVPLKPSKPKVAGAWLVDLTNNRRYDLCQGNTLIGRSDKNDIVVKDPAMSRDHAQIRESHGHFTLYDMGSKTGTQLNGRKMRDRQVLQNGDEITLGDTMLKFVSSD
jgi:pSer/pThr/pTyr-binding forkhead associated (FHA) protein